MNGNPDLPTIFVVDDDDAFRKSLVRLLRSAGYQAESFASADEFLRRWRESPSPGCLLLDVLMPGLNGLELQEEVLSSGVPAAIIFITGHGDIPMSVRAMKAGAVDFLPKPIHEDDLFRAVSEAIRRDREQRARREEHEVLEKRYAALTPREREVMERVVRGMLNKQIAFELGTSEKTVKIHRGRVMEKMQARSLADLVRISEKIGSGDPSA